MDDRTARPTLLSAAKNFMRKSAGKAALVIAPLAVASLAPAAKGEVAVTFGSMITSGAYYSHPSGSSYPGATNIFSGVLAPINGIEGVSFGADTAISTLAGGPNQHLTLGFFGTGGATGSIAPDTLIPFTYAFDLTVHPNVTVTSWQIAFYLYDSSSENNFTYTYNGAGAGTLSGSGLLDINSTNNPNGLPTFTAVNVALTVNFSSLNAGESVAVTMNQLGQGIALNSISAVPEPSTYAAFFGLGALGFVMLRRSRRCAA